MFRSQKDMGNKPRIGWFTLWKSNVSGYPRPAPRPPRSPLSDGPRRRSLASLPLSDMSQIVAAKLVAAKLRRCFLLNFFVCLQLHSKTGKCRDCKAKHEIAPQISLELGNPLLDLKHAYHADRSINYEVQSPNMRLWSITKHACQSNNDSFGLMANGFFNFRTRFHVFFALWRVHLNLETPMDNKELVLNLSRRRLGFGCSVTKLFSSS